MSIQMNARFRSDLKMPYPSRQLLFKFACIGIASLVTFAGVMVSMELLQEIPEEDTNPTHWSGARLHFEHQMKQYEYEACGKCGTPNHNFGSCCRTRLSRKWGPMAPPASRLLKDDFEESKLRMTPQAARWHPFLRRTKGFLIDYSKQSNSTQYTSLFPDPVAYPSSAPAAPIALAPLFGDDYGSIGEIIQWTSPDYTFFPPITDWTEPPIA